jgi:hypothetical protein
VASGRFDAALAAEARESQELRELSDYEARRPSMEEATRVLDVAERFLSGVARLIST